MKEIHLLKEIEAKAADQQIMTRLLQTFMKRIELEEVTRHKKGHMSFPLSKQTELISALKKINNVNKVEIITNGEEMLIDE